MEGGRIRPTFACRSVSRTPRGIEPRSGWATIGPVDMKAGWLLRYSRAVCLSVVSLALAVLAHTSAGGLLPPAWNFAVMIAACTLCNAPFLGREASRLKIVGLLVMGQTSMHFAMSAVAGHAGEEHHANESVWGAITDAAGHLVEDLSSQAPMALAHFAAAIGTGLWLAWGERALWRLLRTLAHLSREALRRLVLPRTAARVFLRPPSPARHVFAAAVVRRHLFLADTQVRRGPPGLLGAF